jgi:cell division protein FtsQ
VNALRAKAGRAGAQRRPTAKGATRHRRAVATRRVAYQLWLNRALVLAAVGAVLAAAGWCVHTLRQIPVQRITVTGELEHTSRAAVEELVEPALSGGFLSADLDLIRGQLRALPWVYEARVRRQWPNALEIRVVEQLPIARWGSGGFLNHEGEVFQSLNAAGWQHLPRLQGPEGAEREMMAAYLRLNELLAPLDLAVLELALDERGELAARLDAGFSLALGRDELVERVQRFALVYQRELRRSEAPLERVDLRYNNGLAVAFRDLPRVAGR